jgi:WD40 repeat protein
VRVWDAEGRQVHSWSYRLVGTFLKGKGDLYALAVGRSWTAVGGRDGHVHLLRAADASTEWSAAASEAPLRAVALDRGERLLAAGSDLGELALLDVSDGRVVSKRRAHRDGVRALAWSGGLLASGSRDRSLKFWVYEDGELRELLALSQPSAVRWLAFHPGGGRLFVLLEGERAVRVVHLDRLFAGLNEMGLGAGLPAIGGTANSL